MARCHARILSDECHLKIHDSGNPSADKARLKKTRRHCPMRQESGQMEQDIWLVGRRNLMRRLCRPYAPRTRPIKSFPHVEKFQTLFKNTSFPERDAIFIRLSTKTLEDFQGVAGFANAIKKDATCLGNWNHQFAELDIPNLVAAWTILRI